MYSLISKAYDKVLSKGSPCIILIDGFPVLLPHECKVICFTSPKLTWFKKATKNPSPEFLYVPLWDLEELLNAATILNLRELDEEMISDRFEFFCGVARHCLNTKPEFAQRQRNDIETKIGNIKSLDEVIDMMEKTSSVEVEDTCHRLTHMIPRQDNPSAYVFRFASSSAERLLLSKLVPNSNVNEPN